MTRVIIAALLVLLGGGGLVLAQTPGSPPAVGTLEPATEPPADSHPATWQQALCGAVDGGAESFGLLSLRADYVLWFRANREQPVPLASTGTGQVETLGDEHLDRHLLSGARFTVGYWLAEPNVWVPGGQIRDLGAEARVFFVGQRTVNSTITGAPTLTRDFLDLNDQLGSSVVVAAPGIASGFVTATAKADLWGAEFNVWKNVCYDSPGTHISLDVMGGMRYLDLEGSVNIGRFSSFVANPQGLLGFDSSFGGNRILEQESFATRNRFFGGQVGARANWFLENVVVSGQFQLALGDTQQDVTINGSQLRIRPNGQTTRSAGALLALPSNIGRFSKDRFTQVPELGLNFLLPIRDHVILGTGFTALYWNRIVRPSNQVDPAIDITQIPNFPGAAKAGPSGLPGPAVPFGQSELWLLGLNFSIEVTW